MTQQKNNIINKVYLAFIGILLLGASLLILMPKKANADEVPQSQTNLEFINTYGYRSFETISIDTDGIGAYNWSLNKTFYIEYDYLVDNSVPQFTVYYIRFTQFVVTLEFNEIRNDDYEPRHYQYTITETIEETSFVVGSFSNLSKTWFIDYPYFNLSFTFDFINSYSFGGIPTNSLSLSIEYDYMYKSSSGDIVYPSGIITETTYEDLSLDGGGTQLDNFSVGSYQPVIVPFGINDILRPIYEYNLDNVNDEPYQPGQDLEGFDFLAEFLSNSVGGFLEFEICPGLSLSTILLFILSVGLLFFLIKVFMGG